MNRAALAMGIVAVAASFAAIGERQAAACGGCFRPPTETDSDITDERMLLSVSTTQTTLYDQIKYTVNPSSFAWVIPIHGTVDVGLSADVLFDSVDALTQTQIQAPPLNCPYPSGCGQSVAAPSAGGAFGGSGSGGSSGGGVTVVKAQNVGPYATVQLATTDPMALNTWLTQNGFEIPAEVQTTLDAYVGEGFNFLAMKLLPGQGVQSMRPVRITFSGALTSLPLRMAAIGTGATVGITIWVVAEGRYEPQNFPFFHIDDSQLVWDFSTSDSNYTTLRKQNELELNGKGWEMESSLTLEEQNIASVILSGGFVGYGFGGAGGSSGAGASSDASQDYLPITNPDGTVSKTADQVRADDLKTLFAGIQGPSVRVTRMRSDISHAAMTADFNLQASQDQSEMSNLRRVTQSINEQCPIYNNNCNVVGTGTPAQAAASGPHAGGCAASPQNPSDLTVALAAVAGFIGLTAIRSRRQRAARR